MIDMIRSRKTACKEGKQMQRICWERLAAILFCAAFGTAALFLGLRYLLPILLPFLLAWTLACCIRPISYRLSDALHISARICSPILLLLLVGGIVWISGLGMRRLFGELSQLAERLLPEVGFLSGEDSTDYFALFGGDRLPILQRPEAGEHVGVLRNRFNQAASDLIASLTESLTTSIPRFLGRAAAALPGLLLATVVTLIAGFGLCMSREDPWVLLGRYLPTRARRYLPCLRGRLRMFFKGYLRAYLQLLLLTFAELLIGFLILRVEYAFLLALLIALVDLLPILGVGTVLAPWAAVMLLQKNYYLGIGLLILFGAVTVLRQIFEPRLVGKSLGLSMGLSLFSGYAGWRLLGFWGMLLGPIIAVLAKSMFVLVRGRES